MRIEITFPIKIKSELNIREHWTVRHKRHKKLHKLICMRFLTHKGRIPLPCIVTLTRVSSRALDDDNLIGAFKTIRDYVADQIIPGMKMGRADNDPRITWKYEQRKGLPKEHAFSIVIETQ